MGFINFEYYIFILRDCYKWLGLPFDFIPTDFWFWCWKFIFRTFSCFRKQVATSFIKCFKILKINRLYGKQEILSSGIETLMVVPLLVR